MNEDIIGDVNPIFDLNVVDDGIDMNMSENVDDNVNDSRSLAIGSNNYVEPPRNVVW